MTAIEMQLIERLKKLPPVRDDEVEAEVQARREDGRWRLSQPGA